MDEQAPLAPETHRSPPASAPRSGTGLALLALLVALGAAAAGGWSLYRQEQAQARYAQLQQQSEQSAARLQGLSAQDQSLSERLGQLPSQDDLNARWRLLATLQTDQDALRHRIEQISGQSQQGWRLVEADHMVRLAALRLQALQDTRSALALLQAADDILAAEDDPGSFSAREQLAKTLTELRSQPQPDRMGLFLRLAALREQGTQLNNLNPEFKPDLDSTPATEEDALNWRHWANRLSDYVRIQTDVDEVTKPLLSQQNLLEVRLALSLALQQAQWAVLNGQPAIYQQSLKQAQELLQTAFNPAQPEVQTLSQQFSGLMNEPVTVNVPDLSSTQAAVQAYVRQREKIAPPPPSTTGSHTP